MLLVDLFDAGVEGGRVVAVEAGKAEVGAVTGLEKALLGKERQRIGLDGLTGLLKVSGIAQELLVGGHVHSVEARILDHRNWRSSFGPPSPRPRGASARSSAM